ncbi:MAG: hypothetical protein DYG90_04000 [Chloroflexi bacterium CFX6]|nr:hypothetical protein [Chloroflexi bacterium CFX6]
MDFDTIVAFLAAVFAVPGATSIVTAVVRKLSDALAVDPSFVVYAVALALTGLLIVSGAVALPEWAGDPSAYVGAWAAWAVMTAELARRLYDQLRTWTASPA